MLPRAFQETTLVIVAGLMTASCPRSGLAQNNIGGDGASSMASMAQHGLGMQHGGGFSGISLSHQGGLHLGGFAQPAGGLGHYGSGLRNPIGYSNFGVGSLSIGFGVPSYSGFGSYYSPYMPYRYGGPSYVPYVGSRLGASRYVGPNPTQLANQPSPARPLAYAQQSPQPYLPQSRGYALPSARRSASSSDLKPGMVLPDGAVVVSVGPVN